MSLLRLLELEDRGASNHGSLNGTTAVDLVTAPASGYTRVVESIRFVNKDTAAVDIRVRKTVGGSTHYEFDNALGLVVDGKFAPVSAEHPIRLTATDQKITAVMGGAAATTNPSFVASYRDVAVAS